MPHLHDQYRWPAYMSRKLRQDLKVYLAKQNITFSEWVRQHAQEDLKRARAGGRAR